MSRAAEFLDPTPSPRLTPPRAVRLPPGGCTGRVLLVERIGNEREDFSFGHLLARGLMVLVAAFSPLLILAASFVVLGPGAVLLVVLAGWLASRVISPAAMFTAWLALWGCRAQPTGVPVLYFRMRTREHGELMVRAKGCLQHGHFFGGDLLTCWGRWENGVLLLRRAFNHRTNSWIEPRSRDTWLMLMVALALCVGAIAILIGAAAQMAEQTHRLP